MRESGLTTLKKNVIISVGLLVIISVCSAVYAQGPTFDRRLSIDFTNRASRSISLRLGSADGISAQVNFAVIDSAGRQIAAFFPYEILTDRFWSGPLKPEDFARIRLGDPVIRIKLDLTQSAILREQFSGRMTVLREERRRNRLEGLEEEKADLVEQLNELDVDLFRLNRELGSLEEDLEREKNYVRRQVKSLGDRVDDLRDERSELTEDREDLVDKKKDLLKRSSPPRDRISDLEEDIADLDQKIRQLNIEINDLWSEIREYKDGTGDIRDEIAHVKEGRSDLYMPTRKLKLELEKVEGEIGRLREEGRP